MSRIRTVYTIELSKTVKLAYHGAVVMWRYSPICATIALVLLMSACQSTQQAVQGKEDLLAAAGFSIKPANSAARLAAMKKLPPHKFVQQTSGTSVVWLYADPTICQCVYFGDQAAWSNYRAMVFAKRIVNEQQMIAVMNQNSFDFGPW